MAKQPFDTSSPRNDLVGDPEAIRQKPSGRGEMSLQQCDSTKLFQWHVRASIYWVHTGKVFQIKANRPTAQGSDTLDATRLAGKAEGDA